MSVTCAGDPSDRMAPYRVDRPRARDTACGRPGTAEKGSAAEQPGRAGQAAHICGFAQLCRALGIGCQWVNKQYGLGPVVRFGTVLRDGNSPGTFKVKIQLAEHATGLSWSYGVGLGFLATLLVFAQVYCHHNI